MKDLTNEQIRAIVEKFPRYFSLPAFPGEKLRVSPSLFDHFWSDYTNDLQIVIQIQDKKSYQWLSLGRNNPEWLHSNLKEVVECQCEHKSHFFEGDNLPERHFYSQAFPEAKTIVQKTIMGKYVTCKDCEDCLIGFLEN